MPIFLEKEQVTQNTAFNSISRFCDTRDKRVLEIGGNSDCVAATPFAIGGASEVLVTGLYHMDEQIAPSHSNIKLQNADALKLTEKYAKHSFDCIYGISVMEHIPRPQDFFSQIAAMLSPGGIAFIQGSPLWTGPWGHHIHLTPWQDGTMGCYQFIPSQELLERGFHTFNPIPDWGHILYEPEARSKHLTAVGVPDEDLSKILSYVYSDDVINREPASAIVREAGKCGLTILELEFDRVYLSPEMRELLMNATSAPDEDFSVMGVRIVFKK